MSRTTRVAVTLVIAAMQLPIGLGLGGTAFAETRQNTVGSVADAWYQTLPVTPCTSPVGCAPADAPASSPFTAGALHVGVVGGQETARAYVRVDLSQLPDDVVLTAGKLRLPVSTDQQAGNLEPATAALRACLVIAAVTDGVEGGVDGAPAIDCAVASAPATVTEEADAFLVDLAPFLAAWDAGTPNHGLAVVPAAEQAQGANWQVGFPGRRAAEPTKVGWTVRYETALVTDDDVVVPESPVVAPPYVAPPVALDNDSLTPPVPAPTVTSPTVRRVVHAGYARTPWFGYRGVVYLPLVLLVAVGVLRRALVQPAPPTQLETVR